MSWMLNGRPWIRCKTQIIVNMSFQFWGATTMGFPDTNALPDTYSLGQRFFLVSLVLQLCIFMLFIYVVVFTFYKAIRNVGSPHVQQSMFDGKEERKPEQDIDAEFQKDIEEAQEHAGKDGFYPNMGADDNLAYNFEEEEARTPKKKRDNKPDNENSKQDKQQEQESQEEEDKQEGREDQEHEAEHKNETEQQMNAKLRLFKYEECFARIVPFTIIYVIAINNFTCDYISVAGFLLTVLFYIGFNMLEVGTRRPVLKNLYLIPTLAGFVPLFLNAPNFSS